MISFEDVLNGLIRQVTVQWRDVLTDFMPKPNKNHRLNRWF